MPSTKYRIEITQINGTGNAAGFVDDKRIERYMAEGSTPTDLTASQNKERANLRYRFVLANLQSMGNLYVSDVVATGATADTAPTEFAFTVEAERGDDMLFTRDETAEGEELSGADAIKRCVARGLMAEQLGRLMDCYDPTTSTGVKDGAPAPAAVRTFNRVAPLDVAKLTNNLTTAEAAITVTKL